MLRHAIAAVAIVLTVASAEPAAAQRVKAGLLTCDVSGGIGLIIGSQKQVACIFTPDQPGPQEAYGGAISKFGLDIGVTAGGVITETVAGRGFLAGEYLGASGEATVAAGLGANVLVGGSNRTVALQPVSVGGQVGHNLAVGVASLRLGPPG